MTDLALDHLTAVDAGPMELVSAAAEAGCKAICLFMEPMAVLPEMPAFDLYGDVAARRALKAHMAAEGVGLDLAYPFTLAGRTDVAAFAHALDCAAELEAGLVNALVYDRDETRRFDNFAAFSAMALERGMGVGLEFFPSSQVKSLADALDLAQQVGQPKRVGVNVDLLHLMRSGGSIAELAAAPADFITYAQVADGPAECAPEDRDFEASSARLLVGDGMFDVAGFLQALPAGCPISVEIPRNAAIAGEGRSTRVGRAIDGVRRLLAQP